MSKQILACARQFFRSLAVRVSWPQFWLVFGCSVRSIGSQGMKFSIRDLLLVTVIVAIAVA